MESYPSKASLGGSLAIKARVINCENFSRYSGYFLVTNARQGEKVRSLNLLSKVTYVAVTSRNNSVFSQGETDPTKCTDKRTNEQVRPLVRRGHLFRCRRIADRQIEAVGRGRQTSRWFGGARPHSRFDAESAIPLIGVTSIDASADAKRTVSRSSHNTAID